MRDYYEDEYYDEYDNYDEYYPEEYEDDYDYEESRFCKRCGYPVRMNEEPIFDDFEDPEAGVWATIPDFPNYEVSIYGEVREKDTGRILRGYINPDGYHMVSLRGQHPISVHRLVATTFYGRPSDPRMQVNHINCVRNDNRVINLEWVTPSRNVKWAVMRGNLDWKKGLQRATEVNKRPVRIVETGQVFASLQDCANYLGVTRGNVSRVLSGERKGQRLHGYHIEYVREEEM